MRPAAALILAILTSACSAIQAVPQVRGNRIDAAQLKDLVPGTSTRVDVTSLIGSPTAKAAFDDNTWIYISEVTQPRVGQIQRIKSQKVVEMTFDEAGVLRGIKEMSQADAQPVSVVARATPSPGSESSFMQQLLGNVGKFSAAGLPGGAGGGGAGGGGTGLGVK